MKDICVRYKYKLLENAVSLTLPQEYAVKNDKKNLLIKANLRQLYLGLSFLFGEMMRKFILTIISGLIIGVILWFLLPNKEQAIYNIMGDNYQGQYAINYINYTAEINVMEFSATHVSSGAVVKFATDDTLEAIPPEVRYPLEAYLKSHNLMNKKEQNY